jgi:hypothetical protein
VVLTCAPLPAAVALDLLGAVEAPQLAAVESGRDERGRLLVARERAGRGNQDPAREDPLRAAGG